MKYQLVLAEKPSVAMTISAVLGATKRNEGYNEGGGYLVSWCYGHLGEFANADAYDDRYQKWRVEDLPIIPKEWSYKVRPDKYEHFKIVKRLMLRNDVETVINACDAGREGERIFRTVYAMAGCKKPVQRLWISSMEDAAIRQGFQNLRPGSDYDNLAAAADCRAKADWLVGINATRLFSVLYHRTLNVGRVVSPTLAMIVQREAEIRTFQPEPFYTVELETEAGKAVSKRIQDKEVAEMLVSACHATNAVVTEVTTQERTEKAPALYDLTTLQREANRLYGFTAQETLDYVQSLYEKKLCTYPRTDANYLTDDMEDNISDYAEIAAGIVGADVPEAASAQVCDSGKVTDHHALIPTASAGDADLAELPAGEQKVLRLIARRLLCAVSGPYRYTVTAADIQCGNDTFTMREKTVQDLGWKKYLEEEPDENPLPELAEGQSLMVKNVVIKGGQTTPPKHFTEDTLLSAMEKAGAAELPKDTERKGLGTPATRASVIEKLVAGGFISRNQVKKTVNLISEDLGISLVTVMPEQLQSPFMTVDWETKLGLIEKGEMTPEEFMAEIEAAVTELVKNYKAVKGAEVLFPSGRPVVGVCPRCGGDVTESKLGYFCEANDCRFALWRDNKFLAGKRINLTRKLASELLKHGRAEVAGMYSERTGKTFDAVLVLADNGERVLYQLDFPNRKGASA